MLTYDYIPAFLIFSCLEICSEKKRMDKSLLKNKQAHKGGRSFGFIYEWTEGWYGEIKGYL